MKKNIKVIEINGLRGMLVVLYGLICAFAGFVVFPAWALMSLWNLCSVYVYNLPKMSIIHGFMLYVVFVLFYFATKSHKSCFGILSATDLSKSNIAAIMKDIDDKK